jgi:hypothetical protein
VVNATGSIPAWRAACPVRACPVRGLMSRNRSNLFITVDRPMLIDRDVGGWILQDTNPALETHSSRSKRVL